MLYTWLNGSKYYKVRLQQNLSKSLDIVCYWGRIAIKRGGYKIIHLVSHNEGDQVINSVKKRPEYRGYKLITTSFD